MASRLLDKAVRLLCVHESSQHEFDVSPHCPPWTEKSFLINVQFADGLPIFSRRVRALVLDQHLAPFLGERVRPVPPLGALRSSYEALIVDGTPTAQRLPRFTLLPDAIRYVPHQYARHYVDLSGSFVDYVRQLPRTLRRSVRRFWKFSDGMFRFREYRTAPEIAVFHDFARQVAMHTYQEKLQASIPGTDEFRRKLLAQAHKGQTLGCILFCNDRPIAYNYCEIDQCIVTGKYAGYDPEFRSCSPGKLTLYLLLERLFVDRQFRIFDLGPGDWPYKAAFSTASVDYATIFFFPRNLKNGGFVLLHSAVQAMRSTAISALRLLGVSETELKRLRRRVLIACARSTDSSITRP